ncbi:MAG: nuclear transport factor 2 family protein [Myxococcota bacterium]
MAPLSPQELSDRIEIDDVLTRYATGVDRKDWDLWETCFTPDAHIDYTAFGGAKGSVKEIREWLEKTMVLFSMSQHLVINREVQLDGDRATARSAFYNPMIWSKGPNAPFITVDGGYYCDQFVRTPDGWKIAERVEEFSYSTRTLPVAAPFGGGGD